ncbi:hypothetical protein ACD661_11160 [Legionella lytica]|uniref:DUF1269 domain-containing protein n=1 Tax=Legionella lytica TaxID=96232 RepID=A0ABW8D8T5_9GAMM
MDDNLLIGVFFTKESAEKAYQEALNAGYLKNEINIIMTEATMKEIYGDLIPSQLSSSASIVQSSSVGAITGGIIGLLAALGTNIFIPAIGLIIAGPLAGVVTGTLMGTLIGLEISEIQAQDYEEKLNNGAIILSLKQKSDGELHKIWRELEKT